jgi:predicted peptidase
LIDEEKFVVCFKRQIYFSQIRKILFRLNLELVHAKSKRNCRIFEKNAMNLCYHLPVSKIFMLHVACCMLHFSLLIPMEAKSQQKGMYFKVEVRKNVILESRFLLYLPGGYDTLDRQWPLMLFLHGSGERGDMLEMVKKNGPPNMIEFGYKFPFIVVSPQCPKDEIWSVDVLDMLLDEMALRYRVDTSRIFVTGLSMGGTGTWDLAVAYPDRFAAIVPICGRGDPDKAAVIKDLPIWVFHGAKDDVVPPELSINMVKALKALGSPVKFTLYPDAGHDAWTETYDNPGLYEWMMEQHR